MNFVLAMRFAVATAVLLCAWADHAAADLYRWVDPETGSVKFSSYPPPWFNDGAAQRRAPKVEVIPPGRPAASSEAPPPDAKAPSKPLPDPGAKLQAPASSLMEDRRKALLKQIASHSANLAAPKTEEGARIFSDLAERVREYNSAEQFLLKVDPRGEGARRAEWNEVVARFEGFRRKMLEQISGIRAPAEAASPDSVRGAWLELGRQLASFAWVDDALKLLDPGNAPGRAAEHAALTEKIAQQWKPALDASQRRPAQ